MDPDDQSHQSGHDLHRFIFGDCAHPLIEIARFQPDRIMQWEPLPLDPAQRTAIGSLFQYAPALAFSAATMIPNTYLVQFSPAIHAQLASGTLTLMQSLDGGVRAMAVTSTGQIVAHGSLVAATGLQAAAAAVAVWQMLAMVTAQHYLPDIQQRLVQIEAGITTIRQWLEAREIATLVTNLTYLNTIGDTVREYLSDRTQLQGLARTLQQIEQIDRECSQVFTTFQMALNRVQASFRTRPLYDWVIGTVERNVSTALDDIATYERYAHACLMAAAVRGVAAEIGYLLPQSLADHTLNLRRLQGIQQQLAPWRADVHQFVAMIRQRAAEIQSPFDMQGVLKNRQSQLCGAADVLQARLTRELERLTPAITQVTQRIDAHRTRVAQPLELLVVLDAQGQVKQVLQQSHPGSAHPGEPSLPFPELTSAEIMFQVVERLHAVPGMLAANWGDCGRAAIVLRLPHGISVRTWTNPLGIEHVFVADQAGTCVYGGFVGWMHTACLHTALAAIAQEWDGVWEEDRRDAV